MNRKKINFFGLILMLLALFSIIPPALAADENTDASGGGSSSGGHKVVCSQTGCANTSSDSGVSGVMFSVVDRAGNRLPGTKSVMITNTSVSGTKKIIARNGIYYNKKESLNNLGYIENAYNWSVNSSNQTIYHKGIANFVHNVNVNKNSKSGGYVLDYLLEWYNSKQKNWEYYAEQCGYSYNNYTYDEIQNHFLIFEPMTTFHVGGNHKYSGTYFATFQQAASLIKYLKSNKTYKGSVSALSGTIPILNRLSPSIYMPTGTAGFAAGTKNTNSWNNVNNHVGNGIGSINIAKTCDDAGIDCGRPLCKIEFNSHFPIDPNTGKVMSVLITERDKDNAKPVADGTEGSLNCCNQLLIDKFNNDKDALCNERPECCYDVPCAPASETDLYSCTSNTSAEYKYPGKDDLNTWYCMKAFDEYSPYIKKTINRYARIVCREDLKASFPTQIKVQQSVGTYMVWPTSTKSDTNNYPLEFNGTMTCKLSIDKAEIDASGNANNIYNDIYNQVISYTNNGNCDANGMCEAKNWYNLNNKINLTVSYNDDEYGGKKVNLTTDEKISFVNLENNNRNETNLYKKLSGITITISNNQTFKLNENTYKYLTSLGTGSNNLHNMFEEVNKNQFVIPKFDYGILPISYTAKVSRNISAGAQDYYKLTLSYSNLGNNGTFIKTEKNYTCPYEVTFAPPTNKDDNYVDNDIHDDNNSAYNYTTECVCPKGTTHCTMDLRGYLIKNPKMTCAQAQAIYCNSDRGNMNVEYRVISLTEPFPGSGETAKTMAQGGRDIGYNWRDSVDQTTSGGVVSTFILNNRRVKGYEVYNLEPLYVIELDSAKIKAIRDYNKTTTYADFNLTCVNDKDGTICTSPFLDQYVSSGTCHTAHTKDKFYKCADKDVPASEK